MGQMNGVDIASYQATLNLNNINYDFVVIKATEGMGYVNPHCDGHYQEAIANGKRRGVYHYARPENDPIAEADYFVDNVLGYVRNGILALDWEGPLVGNVGWALKWLNRVRDRTGVKPLIYMSEWVENNYNWDAVVAADYGLWIAKYSDYEIDNNYDMSNAGQPPTVRHWPFYIMWQWTSVGRINGYAGNLDCNMFYGDTATWDAYAGASTPTPEPTTTTTTTETPPPVPEPTTTTTTSELPPVPDPTTTTTTTEESQPPSSSTTTTTTASPGGPTTGQSWIAGFLAACGIFLLWLLNKLKGDKK